MDLFLYQNTTEKNCITKQLSGMVHLGGHLRESASVTKPVLWIEHENPTTYNYMYITQFNRYYYINDIVSIRNGVWQLEGTCDVLMSFRDDILNCYAVVSDTEQIDTTDYMQSDIWKSLVKSKTDIINFPNGLLESGEYILITAGG